jgi:nicotinate phosphoribosyltransferase
MQRIEPSAGLFIDLYELTMAQAYWQSGRTAPATFSLFFRSYPPDRAYFVFAGLSDVLDYLENLRLTQRDIDYLRSLNLFDSAFLDHLRDFRFTGNVRAMAEGSICFAGEPVLEITAPVIEGQFVETFVLNQVHLQSVLATKASRIVHAAAGRPVIDFAARRTHGLDAANKFTRVSYLVGFAGTSNCSAAAKFGIPVSGTMAHSFILSFEGEGEAFRAFAHAFPDSTTLLVDTYDSIEGTRKAIAIGRDMETRGRQLRAIRLDSGDLLELSRKARTLLDDAGLRDVQILASGGLDEFEIERLVQHSAPIDVYAVGTKPGVSADAPWADGVYKLVEYAGRPVLKTSTSKATLPAPKQVFRNHSPDGRFQHDVIAGLDEHFEGATPLLEEVMIAGKRRGPLPSLDELSHRFRQEFDLLPDRHKAVRSPEKFEVLISDDLQRLRDAAIRDHARHY